MTDRPQAPGTQPALPHDGHGLRALVIDDNRETRSWIAETLALALPMAQVDVAATLAEAMALLLDAASRFDFALIDLDLPDGSGLDIIRAILQHGLPTTPIVITIFDDDATLFEALSAGAQGYILKGVKTAGLVEQFRRIEQGEPPISPRIAQRMLAHFKAMPPPRRTEDAGGCPAELTPREGEVLRLLGKGLTMAEISRHLGISVNTCATHTKAIYRKLNISSRAEAALAADRRGLI